MSTHDSYNNISEREQKKADSFAYAPKRLIREYNRKFNSEYPFVTEELEKNIQNVSDLRNSQGKKPLNLVPQDYKLNIYPDNLKFLSRGMGGCNGEAYFYNTRTGKYEAREINKKFNRELTDWVNAEGPEKEYLDSTLNEKYPSLGVYAARKLTKKVR